MALSSNILAARGVRNAPGSGVPVSGGETVDSANTQVRVFSGSATFHLEESMDGGESWHNLFTNPFPEGTVFLFKGVYEPCPLIRIRWEFGPGESSVDFEARIIGR